MRVDPDFKWLAFDKLTPYVSEENIPHPNELAAMFEATDTSLCGGALLYRDYLNLHIDYDHIRGGPVLYQCRLPDIVLMQNLWQLSPLTKPLVNWYIGYEASTYEELRTHLMARILGC